MQLSVKTKCPFCDNAVLAKVFVYRRPPKDEIRFKFNEDKPYYREILQCSLCHHFISVHEMGTQEIYDGEYVSSTYGSLEDLNRTFKRIISLPPSQSDNEGRVKRILEFAKTRPVLGRKPSILDVGSGLCVFLHRIKKEGWECTALDPDARSVQHAEETVGVNTIRGDFLASYLNRRFDVVTFNKVLEHVEDPVPMLIKSKTCLNPGGFVYVELPDGESASGDGPEREEFAIDHFHIFSAASVALLASRAGLSLCLLERVREPSSKYTFRAFLEEPSKHGH